MEKNIYKPTDLFDKARAFERSKKLKQEGCYPYSQPTSGYVGSRSLMNNREIIMMGSNNYMGLTNHPALAKAAKDAIDQYGSGCTGSRFLNGTLDLHLELEKNLSAFLGKDVVCFSTGLQTNIGVIQAMTAKGEYIISDEANHASIVDGCRLSNATVLVYSHNDMDDLQRVMESVPRNSNKLIITDGVFSMEGDIANLPAILEISDLYNARVMVDDAHGIGFLGKFGKGTCEFFDVLDRVDIIVGTFSKSFASIGGFVAADEEVIEYLRHNARSYMFSAALPPASVAVSIKSIEMIYEGDHLRAQLEKNRVQFQGGLQSLGFNTGNSRTPIIPIIIGDEMKTFLFYFRLLDLGVYANPIVKPASMSGRELIRTSLMAIHDEDEINQVLSICEKAGKEIGII
jgi:8-amino-7-oxononanoate synthase